MDLENHKEKQQFNQLFEVAQENRPGPVLNFDLVHLSPKYTSKMEKALSIDSDKVERK
jgi:hypothetical protein